MSVAYKALRRVSIAGKWYAAGALLPTLSPEVVQWFAENGAGSIAPVSPIDAQRIAADAARAALLPRTRVGGCGACGR